MSVTTIRSRSLRKTSTDAENRIWSLLRDQRLNGFKFRRQHPIGPYFADFCCPSAKLVIELDGGQHNPGQYGYDSARTKYLQKQGFKVLRFWDNDVFSKTDTVIQSVFAALEAS